MADGIFTVSDTLVSLAAGLGTSSDKGSTSVFTFDEKARDELFAAYRGNWMARQVVDVPAADMLKTWRAWSGDDEQIEALYKIERQHNIRAKVKKAIQFDRLYGGGALVLGIGADEPREPVDVRRISQGDLRYVHAMNRYELTANTRRLNPEDPWFGHPEFYQLSLGQSAMMEIHPSRVVPFVSADRLESYTVQDMWGDSILQSVSEAIKNASTAMQVVVSMMHEAKLDIVKIPGLMDQWLSTEEATETLRKRMHTAMTLKSLVNALIMDAEEEYEQKQINFSNFDKLIEQLCGMVAAAADIPITRFLGRSPGGLASTGEGDLRTYYDRLSSEQNIWLRPTLAQLDDVLIRSALGERDDSIDYEWNPLYEATEKEASEIEERRSKTFETYLNAGLVPAGVLASSAQSAMIESGRYPGLKSALDEFEGDTTGFDIEAGDPNDPDDLEGAAVTDGESRALAIFDDDRPHADIARDWGVSVATVKAIKDRKRWRNRLDQERPQ